MNIKSKRKLTIRVALLVGTLAGGGALAQDPPAKVEGEVIRVMQQTRAGEPEALDAVMIRTRRGEQMRLVLGESGSCVGCVQVGDQVRARLSKGSSSSDGYRVRSMKVQRTGGKTRFRNASGDLVQARSRSRTANGTAFRDRSRDRVHRPGTGNGAAARSGNGGGSKRR